MPTPVRFHGRITVDLNECSPQQMADLHALLKAHYEAPDPGPFYLECALEPPIDVKDPHNGRRTIYGASSVTTYGTPTKTTPAKTPARARTQKRTPAARTATRGRG